MDSSTRISLVPRRCPVCQSGAESAAPFLSRNLDPDRLNALSYASRKAPEFMCYELVRCTHCDVIYASESVDAAQSGDAYHQAEFDSSNEARDAALSYAQTLDSVLNTMPDRHGALDIGTGTGVFLQQLSVRGFSGQQGIEPSAAAIAAAADDIRPHIHEGIFEPSQYQPESFALISCFMTLEHVHDPAALVAACRDMLKPGGVMVVVVHDWRAWNNRLLGRKSPIIDIEHLQLFSTQSVTALFKNSGFGTVECASFYNRYRLEYWAKLLPLPSPIKAGVFRLLKGAGLADKKASMNVGNLMVVARKDSAG